MSGEKYTVMPLRFRRVSGQILITGEAGDYHFMTPKNFWDYINGDLSENSKDYFDLKSKNLIVEGAQELAQAVDMTATRYRSRKFFLNMFTSLHMLVVTVRCNQKCKYCQVSCDDEDAYKLDMSPETACKVVDVIFQSPSPNIKIEFQGGEPLLNWETVERTVKYAEQKNKYFNKQLSFVVCTNLMALDEEKLLFFKEHNIAISTSLDGPKEIHDANRVFRLGGGTYSTFMEKLALARRVLSADGVDALMTTTSTSVTRLCDVVDEYVRLGFPGVFLRSLNPYGFASDNAVSLNYPMETFIENYKKCLMYIIELNLRGTRFVEHYATLLLTRILTPFSTGFVDLQSPSGAGISGVIYDYNGDVYPADEARMLSRMGDKYFLLGNVVTSEYKNIFNGKKLREIVNKSCLEIMPVCADCAYLPYCGADPIRNYLETKDIVGKRSVSPFCNKHIGIFDFIFDLLCKGDKDILDVFWSWITRRSLAEVRNEDN